MNEITDEKIYEVREKLNNRPKKSLNFFTPNQAYVYLPQSGRF